MMSLQAFIPVFSCFSTAFLVLPLHSGWIALRLGLFISVVYQPCMLQYVSSSLFSGLYLFSFFYLSVICSVLVKKKGKILA